MKMHRNICALVCAALILVPLAACSQTGKGGESGRSGTSSGGSSQTQITGKVTSVVGNQVVLAVGTLDRSGKNSSSDAADGSQSDSSDSQITLTGESKTVLIPVGLSLTTGNSKRSSSSASGNSQGNAQGGAPTGGGLSGGSQGTSGGSNEKSGGSGSTAAATRTTQKTRDFSSITKGMILQITEKTLSDGTQGIVKVAVLSE